MSNSLIMPALSLKSIREYASKIRHVFGFLPDEYIDIVGILERLPDMGVEIEIATMKEMGDKHGETFPTVPLIKIREDVYERACDGQARDRMTIAHEVGHLFLHGQEKISLARLSNNTAVPAYLDPEWQANAFAGELLAPYKYIKELSVSNIRDKYGVSITAASIQKNRRVCS